MKHALSESHIRALCYADVFSYPLTHTELETLAIASPQKTRKSTKTYSQYTEHLDTYYCLKGRKKIISQRKKRQRYSRKKLKTAQKIAAVLAWIPTIQLIGVSGAVAMHNAQQKDDIDFILITKTGWIWTTRLLVVLLLSLLGVRRRPGDMDVSDKICANMYVDEAHMVLPPKERDVFSAHEVVQMHVVYSTDSVETRFYAKNKWAYDYLPNATGYNANSNTAGRRTWFNAALDILGNSIPIEKAAQYIQLHYMKKRRTTEVIKHGYLRFHPRDARTWVLADYQKRLGQVGLK